MEAHQKEVLLPVRVTGKAVSCEGAFKRVEYSLLHAPSLSLSLSLSLSPDAKFERIRRQIEEASQEIRKQSE